MALFNNWLVNTTGKPGKFSELDLMQEHHNFWLEELTQHKGKEFSDKWYCDVLSMRMHHFLQLKEEMEANVEITSKKKTIWLHTSIMRFWLRSKCAESMTCICIMEAAVWDTL